MPYKTNEEKLRNAARYRALPENRDRQKAYLRNLYYSNKETVLADRRAFYAENRNRILVERRDKKYDLAPGQYDALMVKQGNRCPVCDGAFTGVGKAAYAPALDHCHDTNKVRGILHNLCNRGLGMLKDSAVLCEQAAKYLRDNG